MVVCARGVTTVLVAVHHCNRPTPAARLSRAASYLPSFLPLLHQLYVPGGFHGVRYAGGVARVPFVPPSYLCAFRDAVAFCSPWTAFLFIF